MKNKLVPTANTREADRVLKNIHAKNASGLVLIYGETGFGKTYYGMLKTFRSGWGYYRFHAVDNAKSFLEEIYKRLNKAVNGSEEILKGNTAKLEKACIELFRQKPGYTLVIDEVNLAIQFRKWEIIEIIRDFKDEGGATLIMIGEHDTKDGLKGYNPHFFSRCEFVRFEANSNEDIAAVIKNTTSIEFDGEIYADIITRAGGNLHLANTMIREFEQIARRKKRKTLKMEDTRQS